jgi:excinuclease ABC subunit A
MRLLYARAGEAFSYLTGKKMVRQSEDQILETIIQNFTGKKLILLAPVVKGRKGHYRELFVQIRKSGFTKVRVDGEVKEITAKMQVDRYKIHDIEIVVDRIVADIKDVHRIGQSINRCLKEGKGVMMVMEEKTPKPVCHMMNQHQIIFPLTHLMEPVRFATDLDKLKRLLKSL